MKIKIIILLGIVSILMIFFVLGWIGNNIYHKNIEEKIVNTENKQENTVQGLWLGNYNESRVDQVTTEKEPRGDWVCVNVRDMSFDRCKEVVQHECAHELWAEICEKDDELCTRGQELLDNYSKDGK